jgi:hypothetical protein
MSVLDKIQSDLTAAMKTRDELRLSTLRLVKTALKNREIEKSASLDDAESQQTLATLVKQRKDSIEQYAKGGRDDLAAKEAAEIAVIEAYLPRSAGEAEIRGAIEAVLAEMGGATLKQMGAVMKGVAARLQASGLRGDGKVVSELVKARLG